MMKTEWRHYAEICAGHFTEVIQQWNLTDKVTTLSTDSARNMIAAARQLPRFDHIPCFAHSLQRSVTVCLHNSAFDNVLSKCRKVVGHFKHSPANTAELEQKQAEHGQKKEALVQDVPTRWNSTLDMIKSIRRNEQPLSDVLTTSTKIAMPTPAEMDELQRLETQQEPCRCHFGVLIHTP
ncbi:E3 SUMO-protein ligase ZBED1-like isoform X2 [Entelurus aequoreus]|uniref:E3 SUMO-protein ligase ZBED1-like isoform X2 n=1 Tax=Entelurus aequoreus TaxID=161455 RepID=UPI002B1CFE21|nr:E3 SUMO-protein ligase ZBED1-like isoform X2 [Entelurus aequoreus]